MKHFGKYPLTHLPIHSSILPSFQSSILPFFQTSTLIIFILFLSSCEKVITVDLNSADPKPVVEANVTDQPGPYTVRLTNTANYYDPNVFPAITGAGVNISDNAGNSEALTEISAGIYQTSTLVGAMGRIYTLSISSKGKQYSAVSTMPYNVPIDSVLFQQNGNGNQNNNLFPTYRVVCKFKDPIGVANFYMLQVNSNDTLGVNQFNTRVLSDKLLDGTELSMTYRTHLLIGDSVTVTLKSIDKPTYDFYNTLPEAIGSGNGFLSSLPANPLTNITNGGLGYFSAYSTTKMSAVVH